eukprot:1805543-Rhodomonas_salina.2
MAVSENCTDSRRRGAREDAEQARKHSGREGERWKWGGEGGGGRDKAGRDERGRGSEERK